MRIIFMGTPDFAVAALDALCSSEHEVILAVTQPDRQKGRGRKVIKTPVKECAEKRGVPVFQPLKIRDAQALERIRSLSPDLIVVAAFGQILPQELLDIPKYGCINIHASLLPKLRGAAPIQWSVINGDKESGITLMQMDAGLDTGDILFQKKVEITGEETGESLYYKLAGLGGEMIVRCLPDVEAGRLCPVPQNNDESTYAPMLKKEMGEIDWSLPAREIGQRVRGMLPWPGAYTFLNGRVLKIWKARPATAEELSLAPKNGQDIPAPGTVLFADKKALYASTGDGVLAILELQAEGKKRMETGAFLLGTKVPAGSVFG